MSKAASESCRIGKHIDCSDCLCNCHVPGTIENLSRNIALLEKTRPGIGESI
jgi:hypothetical protein